MMILVPLLLAMAVPSDPPLLAVITIDTLRADRLTCYGAPTAKTPNIDRLAQQGVRFAHAYTVAPITLVAHASLMTGQYPPVHGVRDNGLFVLPQGVTTLAEVLHDHGFTTAAFVSAFVLDSLFGLDQGFDHYDDDFQVMFGGALGVDERDARATTDAAIAWLAQAPQQPIFLWVHYYDPHAPYAPPEPFATQDAEHPYEGEIAFVDQELGRLVTALEKRSAVRTIVLTADHGEALGEHGENTHGIFLYESVAHVPLIVTGTGIEAGKSNAAFASLVDVLPTMLARAKVAVPETIAGRDLLLGEDAQRTLYLETYLPRFTFGWAALNAVLSPPFKLIVAPRPELYDVTTDARELHDLAADHADVVTKMRADLARLEKDTLAPPTTLDADAKAKLARLGYTSAADAARVDPKDRIAQAAQVDQAEALYTQGEIEQAVTLYRRALEKDPQNPYVLERLGSSLVSLEKYADAIPLLDRAQKLRPIAGPQRFQLALAYQAVGNLDRAKALMESLKTENPRFAPASIWLARLCQHSGRIAEAIQHYQDILANWHGDKAAAELFRAELKRLEDDR